MCANSEKAECVCVWSRKKHHFRYPVVSCVDRNTLLFLSVLFMNFWGVSVEILCIGWMSVRIVCRNYTYMLIYKYNKPLECDWTRNKSTRAGEYEDMYTNLFACVKANESQIIIHKGSCRDYGGYSTFKFHRVRWTLIIIIIKHELYHVLDYPAICVTGNVDHIIKKS